jgi:hypothetical protein
MDTNTNLIDLQFDNSTQALLRETAKWAKFISIVGFIFCGLLVLGGIFAGTLFSNLSTNPYGNTGMPTAAMGSMFTVIYIICALVYFFPCLFLFKFASRMQVALRSSDQQTLVSSIGNLRAYFRFVGILLIIGLSIWVLALVFGGLGAALSGMK